VVPRASGPIFMFFVPEPVFGGTKGVRFNFHILLSSARFRRHRGRRVKFSYFTLPDPFSAIPRASDPVFIFCTPALVFDGIEGTDFSFHVLRFHTHVRGTKGAGSSFHILRSQIRVRIQFSYFALPFSAIPRASDPVFIFCTSGLDFDGIEGANFSLNFLRF
jgi:hypothetical protein